MHRDCHDQLAIDVFAALTPGISGVGGEGPRQGDVPLILDAMHHVPRRPAGKAARKLMETLQLPWARVS